MTTAVSYKNPVNLRESVERTILPSLPKSEVVRIGKDAVAAELQNAAQSTVFNFVSDLSVLRNTEYVRVNAEVMLSGMSFLGASDMVRIKGVAEEVPGADVPTVLAALHNLEYLGYLRRLSGLVKCDYTTAFVFVARRLLNAGVLELTEAGDLIYSHEAPNRRMPELANILGNSK